MPRPKNKEELLNVAETSYEKLLQLIDKRTPKEL